MAGCFGTPRLSRLWSKATQHDYSESGKVACPLAAREVVLRKMPLLRAARGRRDQEAGVEVPIVSRHRYQFPEVGTA